MALPLPQPILLLTYFLHSPPSPSLPLPQEVRLSGRSRFATIPAFITAVLMPHTTLVRHI